MNNDLLVRDELCVYNDDCISGARRRLPDKCIELMICDPPFGIGESSFCRHYNRAEENVIGGYVEAPEDYARFSLDWMTEAKRVLKDDGSMYVVSGHTNLFEVMAAARQLGLATINHIIWKYSFGVCTRRKFVTSHYHVLYLAKSARARRTFERNCRFADDARDARGSLLYRDMEDVWQIPRENQRGQVKNANKLPEELAAKMIRYSSRPGDRVGDFFLGNFTTAAVARKLGRRAVGFELNTAAFEFHAERVSQIPFGCDLAPTVDPQPAVAVGAAMPDDCFAAA